jgi:lysophospholipid acyltransferase (LPLAT)-like uncharacterized protein
MKLRHPFVIRLIAFVGAWLVRVWMGTVRYCVTFVDQVHPADVRRARFIYAFWHEGLLGPAALKVKVHMLISQHADGEVIAQICRLLGHGVVRGSSTRGGSVALLELLRCSQRTHLGMTPDGPQGPRRRVKTGIIFMASLTGLPIVPIGICFANAWRLRSWDRFAIPKPWSCIMAVAGQAIYVPPNVARDQLEHYRLQVEEQLLQVTEAAERWAQTGKKPTRESLLEPRKVSACIHQDRENGESTVNKQLGEGRVVFHRFNCSLPTGNGVLSSSADQIPTPSFMKGADDGS